MLTMSPSCRGRESGMPWHMTSLIDVHTLFGKPPAAVTVITPSKVGHAAEVSCNLSSVLL